ncbi:MAG: phenylalanine--tRNA ligase subunit beta [Candidatus Dormibacteria bacterium]
MKLSLNWLSSLVDLSGLSLDEITSTLIQSGTEVNSALPTLFGVIASRITFLEWVGSKDHPLAVCTVDTGDGTHKNLVSGAPNLREGLLVPFAPLGTYLPIIDLLIEPRSFGRGKWISEGMLCSARELGLSNEHEGIFLLDKGEPGQPLSELVQGDTVLDVEITTNRPDCLSHWGIARELSALLERPLHPLHWELPEGAHATPHGNLHPCSVTVEDTDGCRRFTATVMDHIAVGPSPQWMQQRLLSIGVRPIDVIVDISNYVAHELGEPLHMFDYDVVASDSRTPGRAELVIRRAQEGERLLCLDGVERQCTTEDVLVCSPASALSLAGIMGGEHSGISPSTTRVIIEAASWSPSRIRRTSHRLGIRTDASALFEKDLSTDLPPVAIERAASLVAALAGGALAVRENIDVHPFAHAPAPPVEVSAATIAGILGYPVEHASVVSIMTRLGATVEEQSGTFLITSPVLRGDLVLPEDIAEEVGRCIGYDSLPATLPGRRRSAVAPEKYLIDVDAHIRDIALGAGFTEARTTSFVSEEECAAALPACTQPNGSGIPPAVTITNPLTDIGSKLRTSLLSTLLRSLVLNVNRGVPSPRLFELGNVYWEGARTELPAGTMPDGVDETLTPLPLEPRTFAMASSVPERDSDGAAQLLHLMRRTVERIVAEMGSIHQIDWLQSSTPHSLFHPGRVAWAHVNGKPVGYAGELSRASCENLDCRDRIVVLECNLDSFITAGDIPVQYPSPPRFPAISEDIALAVPVHISGHDLLQEVTENGGPLLESVRVIDMYRGSGLPDEHRGYTVRMIFRSPERTLTNEEVSSIRTSVLTHLETKLGVTQRS